LLQTALAKKDKCSLLNLPAGRQVFGFVVLICIAVLGGGLGATPLVTLSFYTKLLQLFIETYG